MKDEDIKLPGLESLNFCKRWHDDIQEYARQAVRMNSGSLVGKEQEAAWWAVVKALDVVSPGWILHPGSAMDLAVKTIQDLGAKAAAAQPKPSDPEPFDLARAMAGEPIVTRDGRKVKFVAHVPELKSADARVLVLVEGDDHVSCFSETGEYMKKEKSKDDLFMAPKSKRTVWVNIWGSKNEVGGGVHLSKENAIIAASNNGSYLAIAHPIEIDA